MTARPLDALQQRWPGRESLVSTLFSLWSTFPPPFVHISDPTTTQVIAKLLSELLSVIHQSTEALELFTVQLNATECVSTKVLFNRILNGLANWTPSWEDGAENWTNATGERFDQTLDAFVHGLRSLYQWKLGVGSQQQASLIIVIESAERLKDFVPTLINPLARLADLTSLPVSVVFLSALTWEEVRPEIRVLLSHTPYLYRLFLKKIVTYLKLRFVESADETCPNPFHPIFQSIFNSFVEFVYGVCAPYTQDPVEIGYVLSAYWPLFICPIVNEWDYANEKGEEYEIPHWAQAGLYAIIKPHIGSAIRSLYPRLIDADMWALQQDFTRTRWVWHGLPVLSRYLLVASYLASFNPIKMDVRILGQIRDPTRRYRKLGVRKARQGTALKIGHVLTGPAPFPFDRLWAITGALMEVFGSNEKPPWSNNLTSPGMFSESEVTRVHSLSQIENLVARRLLIRTTSQEKLETQTSFRCAISIEQASVISDSLGFKLGPLLYEEQQ